MHASIIGHFCFIDFRATIKNAVIGNYCHVGIGAIITDVTIGNGRYIADGQIINTQLAADTLPMVTPHVHEKDQDFNKEVVHVNTNLVRLYRARERKKK